jgi:rare lipoprotein A
MGRWLVILSLAVVQWPEVAVASSKSSDPPLWQRLLSTFTPIPRPAPRRQGHRVKAATVAAEPLEPTHLAHATDEDAAVTAAAPPPLAEPDPARSIGTGCNGGRRIVSAFYSQGQRTASGQPFDPLAMTAAHRTLPFGTRLTVTNPRTGKSVIVFVNDRGPFVTGVSLDLSLGAAQAIGLRGTGTVCIW